MTTTLPDKMHCWLMAKREVGGSSCIPVRGINWLGEYNHIMDGIAWHVPTVKFAFNLDQGVPQENEIIERVVQKAKREWPQLGLKPEQVVLMEQELTGQWGGWEEGRPQPVTRIAFDLGVSTDVSAMIYRPGESLDRPRQPVIWIPASSVVKMASEPPLYVVTGSQSVTMEKNTRGSKMRVIANDIEFQSTVAEMFEHAFGGHRLLLPMVPPMSTLAPAPHARPPFAVPANLF